jgi:CheY-specific phosphatase CheX
MRATVKNRVAVFTLQGFLDGTNAPFFIALDDIKHTYTLNVDMILISLKRVVYFNVNGLKILSEILLDFRKKLKCTVGFCDYDQGKYETILRFNKDTISFSLFKTLEIAHLFVSSNKEEKTKDLLVWNEDASQRNGIAIDLFERGHNPIVAQTKLDFEKKLKDSDKYDHVVENTYIGFSGNKISTRVAGNAIIYTIKGFLDAEISDNFDYTYHTNSLNVNFQLFVFDAIQVVSMNVHALNFFSKLATAGAEYDATICIIGLDFTKTPMKYKEELEDVGILFFDLLGDVLSNRELMDELTSSSAGITKPKRSITKIMVNNLPNFIEATVSSFEMMTNSKAEKKSATLSTLNIEAQENLFCSSIGFYGDIDGIVMLIFPVDIAHQACALLLGEENPSDEDTLDTISEFVNIIGGRVKAILAENNEINVNITLPRTYTDINGLLDMTAGKKGVQVDLALGEQSFTFFLTR